jgi:periplasmic protein TonB
MKSIRNCVTGMILLLSCFFSATQFCYSQDDQETEAVYTIVETMPLFPGCENVEEVQARASCSNQKVLAFLSGKIKYPAEALENGIKGTVYVSFVIDREGNVTNTKVLRGIGSGCDEEALRVVNEMPQWIPGTQRGKPVKVQYNLPIRFMLK